MRLESGAGQVEAVTVAPLAPPEVIDGPRLVLPNRAYLVLSGQVHEAADLLDALGSESPNPPELEALPARITDGVTFDSDRLNAELDDM